MDKQDLKEHEYSEKLMGSTFEVSIISNSKELADQEFTKIFEMGKNYEKVFSRFDETSELSRLNKLKEMTVSDIFLEVMLIAKKLHETTNGYFNPLFQIKNLGYYKTFDDLSLEKLEIRETNSDFDFEKVLIDKENKKIVLEQNQELDFGGFLKGYVAQKLANELTEFNGAIVNIGGDLYTRGKDENNQKFKFNIYNPIKENYEFHIELENSGLATSGIYKRKWKVGEQEHFHILDKTGKSNPKNDLISSSIFDTDGSICEAFATTAIMLGSREAERFLKEKAINFVLIKTDGQIISNI